MTGYTFAVSVNVQNEGTTPIEVTIAPSVVNAAQCTIVGYDVDSGQDPDDNSYVLAPGNDGQSIRDAVKPYDMGESAEPSQALPQDYVRISFHLDIPTNINTGNCEMNVEIVEKQLLDTIVHPPLEEIMEIVPATNFRFMGEMKGKGGAWEDDRIEYYQSAEVLDPVSQATTTLVAGNNVVYGVNGEAKVMYGGLHSQKDGTDWGDRGKFWFAKDTKEGEVVGNIITNQDNGKPSLLTATETLETGNTYTRCYIGEYIDGGSYDDSEDVDTKCYTFEVRELENLARVTMTISELDSEINDLLSDYVWGLLGQPISVADKVDKVGIVYIETPDGGWIALDRPTYDHLQTTG